ncbi:MAG: tRNA 2-thiocytidine(32) synthetase TtcA, partial [Erysipelotrichaceae bacterium]|nr:tRNA 2-thiocytidine(32) synthetase TtcA [Erysipelotrichaceae bacterium]
MNSMKHILGQMRRADHDYHLIEDGDRIAVGLSGGKDSSLLIYSLYIYQKLAEKSLGKRFEILGIHIDLNFGEEDFTPLWNFLDRYQIPYVAEKSRIADILGLYLKDGKVQCSRCSQLKKGAVIKTAKENGCNKIAYGHHADDAIETLLLNMIYGAKIASFEPNMYLSREDIRLIRPFIYCE